MVSSFKKSCHMMSYEVMSCDVTSNVTFCHIIGGGPGGGILKGSASHSSSCLCVCVCRSAARNSVPDLSAGHRGSHGGESLLSHRGHRSVAGGMRLWGHIRLQRSLHCFLKGWWLMVAGRRSGALSEPVYGSVLVAAIQVGLNIIHWFKYLKKQWHGI